MELTQQQFNQLVTSATNYRALLGRVNTYREVATELNTLSTTLLKYNRKKESLLLDLVARGFWKKADNLWLRKGAEAQRSYFKQINTIMEKNK